MLGIRGQMGLFSINFWKTNALDWNKNKVNRRADREFVNDSETGNVRNIKE